MPVTGFSLDVKLGTIPLRLVTGEGGSPAYREERISGADVPGQAATVHFSDEFTSWHKGGFVTEDVQDGYYGTSENVDCSYPGRIFPSFRRQTNIDLAPRQDGGTDLPFGPIAGIGSWPWHASAPAIVTFYHRSANAGTQLADAITVSNLAEDGTEGDTLTTSLTLNSYHYNYIEPVWFLDRWFIPMVDKGYVSHDGGGWVLHGNVPVWNFGVAPDRFYRLHVSSGYLYISNMDVSDDPTALASWTNPGLRIPYVGSNDFELARVYTMGRFPYIATKAGVFSIGKGGFAEALFPQFLAAPSRGYDFKAFRYYNTLLATATASGQILLLNGEKATHVGPLVNPLSRFPNGNAPQVVDIFSTSTGIMFVTTWDGTNRAIWKGVPRTPGETGPGLLAWHQIINITGDPNTSSNLSMTRPLAIINFSVGTPYASATKTWLWYGAGNGRIFRWNIGSWGDLEGGSIQHEDGASRQADSGTADGAVTTDDTTLTDTRESLHWIVDEWVGFVVTCNGKTMTVTSNTTTALTGASWSGGGNPGNGNSWTLDETTPTVWTSGRYDRGHKKAYKHWTTLGFITENLSGDQTIDVQYRVNGGSYVAAGTLNTGPYQRIAIDAFGYDIEVRLYFHPQTTTGITSPPTVRRIVYEGREVPQQLTLISMTCEGDPAPQAGGVRQRDWANAMLIAINTLSESLKQTFLDPFKVDRTVVVLPTTEEDIHRAQGSQVPQAGINIRLLVVPS
jgi:hypothetical protein